MSRRLAFALVLALPLGACKDKPPAPSPLAQAAPFDTLVVRRDDCLHHAAAVTAVDGGWLVVAACGGGGAGETGREEILAVRLDARGGPSVPETVAMPPEAWVTNVTVAGIPRGGAIVGWTEARARRAGAVVAAVDAQGRPVGVPLALGAGRLIALVGGPGGALAVVWRTPDTASDAMPDVRAEVELVLVDADARLRSRTLLTGAAEGDDAQVGASATATGYAVTWREAGALAFAQIDAAGQVGARVPLLPVAAGDAASAPTGRITWPALAVHGDQVSAAVVAADGEAEAVWLAEGPLVTPAAWRWRKALPTAPAYRRLALQRGASTVVGVLERQGEDYVVRLAQIGGAGASAVTITEPVAIFDGPLAMAAGEGGWVAVAAASPPTDAGVSAVRVVAKDFR